jgi:leucyl/phenylalanyl-tRNA--protein transferase
LKSQHATFDPQRPTPELLLVAYRHGVFPMADPCSGRLDWLSPDPRGILPLEAFHIPRSLARVVRSGRFQVRFDTAFDAVIRACAAPRPEEPDTWIDARLIRAYIALHRLGHAHSVEAWIADPSGGARPGVLAGGLYGVHIGSAFFGESMFTRPGPRNESANASKVCLVHLVEHLRRRGFTLLDTQFHNVHLAQFGCIEIPRAEYLHRLAEAVDRPAEWAL